MTRATVKRILMIVTLAGIASAASMGLYLKRGRDTAESYRTVPVTRGSIESSVSATGTLGAVNTVQVGTQVSGQIAELRADYNDRVKKGQLLARLDPTLLQQVVSQAEADLTKAQAD